MINNDFDIYQKETRKTVVYPRSDSISYLTLGLNGESGEIAEKVKKVIRDEGGEFTDEKREEIVVEAGDCIWYLARLIDELGFDFSQVAEMNLDKLFDRKEKNKLHGEGDER